jgi:hypothetical protein
LILAGARVLNMAPFSTEAPMRVKPPPNDPARTAVNSAEPRPNGGTPSGKAPGPARRYQPSDLSG